MAPCGPTVAISQNIKWMKFWKIFPSISILTSIKHIFNGCHQKRLCIKQWPLFAIFPDSLVRSGLGTWTSHLYHEHKWKTLKNFFSTSETQMMGLERPNRQRAFLHRCSSSIHLWSLLLVYLFQKVNRLWLVIPTNYLLACCKFRAGKFKRFKIP